MDPEPPLLLTKAGGGGAYTCGGGGRNAFPGGGEVLGTLRQHDLQVEGHYVAIVVVDHHKDYFSVPPATAHSTHV